jgi:hypothetical protein
MALAVSISPSFARLARKLHPSDKAALDKAVTLIAKNPAAGQEKVGDLAGVFVYKFKMNKRETLLACVLQPDKLAPEEIVLQAFGPHENFYTQLKR